MAFPASSLWLIPGLPFLAAALIAFLPRSARRVASTLAITALAGSFVLSVWALRTALAEPSVHAVHNFTWLDAGAASIRFGFLLDPLSAVMTTMVTFVGTLIFIFSLGYLRHDTNATRFFCFLSLFAGAMLGLLVSNSLLLLFACWELVGLASYLLIGFWFHKPSAAAAAKKAFLTTRVGDLGFLLGLLWLAHTHGSLLLYDQGQGLLEAQGLARVLSAGLVGGLPVVTAISLLLFCGAAGKSGQVPLHIWLPDAMEGPTPVSALIHAATMVAAGVFLLARIFPLLAADQTLPAVPIHTLTVIAMIGGLTAVYGAAVAVAQNDLKRILAFSTVSQLGYMMLAIGVGAWTAAVFHLLTHAFFKALLFLGAGSVIDACHHQQDIRLLGGLGKRLRITFATFLLGTFALQGIPLFSGFWSKEAILHQAHLWPVSHFPFVAALLGVGLTAFYMTRLLVLTFSGDVVRDPHLAEHPPHESSRVMTVPLLLLCVGAVGLGFCNTPFAPWLESWLTGVAVSAQTWSEFSHGLGLLGLSVALVAFGLGLGVLLYRPFAPHAAHAPDPLQRRFPRLHRALSLRLGFDEAYAQFLYPAFFSCAAFVAFCERRIWEASLSACSALARFLGLANRDFEDDGLNGGFNQASASLAAAGSNYRATQSGSLHAYLRTLAFGFIALLLFVSLGGLF